MELVDAPHVGEDGGDLLGGEVALHPLVEHLPVKYSSGTGVAAVRGRGTQSLQLGGIKCESALARKADSARIRLHEFPL